jgi:hypothetical protein
MPRVLRSLSFIHYLSGFLLTTRAHFWGAAKATVTGWWPSTDPAPSTFGTFFCHISHLFFNLINAIHPALTHSIEHVQHLKVNSDASSRAKGRHV